MELPLHSSSSPSVSSLAESGSHHRHHVHSAQHHHTQRVTQSASSSSVHIPIAASLHIDTGIKNDATSLPSPELSSAEDFYEARDPMSLESKRMPEDQIKAMRRSRRNVQAFYREQNELITDLIDPIEGREGAKEQEEKNQLKLKIAIYGSVGVNVLLFLLQLYAAISSKSLSLLATMADSFMDLLSGVILMFAARASTTSNWHKYPSGKSRMETAGTIVFASLMATVSLQLIIESVRSLTDGNKEPPMPNSLAIAFVGFALASKLGLYVYCKAISQYNAANILAIDHRNDLVVNGFGLVASLLSRFCWWLDAAGAILVALIILRSWASTAYEQIQLIVGKAADPAFLKKVTYIALTHHRKVLQVDNCIAYHAGNNVFVELDVVMDRETPLWESHDISESLQVKLESLPNVERAFVHVDHETSHAPEHRKMNLRALLNQEEEMEELFDDEGVDEEFEIEGREEEDIVDSDFDQSSADEEPQDDEESNLAEDPEESRARRKQQAMLTHLKTGKSSFSAPERLRSEASPTTSRAKVASSTAGRARSSRQSAVLPSRRDIPASSSASPRRASSSATASPASSSVAIRIPAEIRKSSRRTTVLNKQETELKLLEYETRKAMQPKREKAVVHKMTQQELLEEARKTEALNLASLQAFKAQEMEKKKVIKKKEVAMGPFIRYHSFAEWVGHGPLIQALADVGTTTPGGETRPSTRPGSRQESRAGSVAPEIVPTQYGAGGVGGVPPQSLAQSLAQSLHRQQQEQQRLRSISMSRDPSPTAQGRSRKVKVEFDGLHSGPDSPGSFLDLEAPSQDVEMNAVQDRTSEAPPSGTLTPAHWVAVNMSAGSIARKRKRLHPSQMCGRNWITFMGYDDEDSPINEWSFAENYPERKPMCPITGLPAKYKDPRSGIPYANKEAYKILQNVIRHGYVWSNGLNAYCHDVAQPLPKSVPAGMAEALIGGQQIGEGIVLKDGDLVSAGIPGGGGGGYTYRRRQQAHHKYQD
ncbi:hypothetical protein BGZ99_004926 [Dissophora globulifera]|uniref:Vps72/YL1 C-terminal domain-containing protein n=1 Tax=Dissophora globulifera TaxID=979702 RepID=A0A9P6RSU7_9FUNG|nr:hypothetical protein BGZ99_004926 [Dissophora globulifera]